MDKLSYFKEEISYIKDSSLRSDLKTLIELLPDYFFEVPASSTGKYHPAFAAGDGGLVRHTKVAVRFAYELLNNNTVGCKFSPRDKDLILMALTLHDGLKHGYTHERYVKFEHPLLASKFIMENKDKISTNLWYGIGNNKFMDKKPSFVSWLKKMLDVKKLTKIINNYEKQEEK